MQTIAAKIAKLEKVQREIETYPIELSKQHEAQIIDWNKVNLYAGIGSTGDEIYPDYTNYTKDIKDQLRQPSNRVTLKDTGRFHNSIELKFNLKDIFFNATDWKYPTLRTKYEEDGNVILGITDENMIDLRELIKPDLIELIRKKTN